MKNITKQLRGEFCFSQHPIFKPVLKRFRYAHCSSAGRVLSRIWLEVWWEVGSLVRDQIREDIKLWTPSS